MAGRSSLDTDSLEPLAAVLAAEGLSRSADDLAQLIAGVSAAPNESDPDGWMTLVTPTPSDNLRRALAEAKREYERRREARPAVPESERVSGLRTQLAEQSLSGILVPRADEHQGEYVPARASRLAWLTGFTGSAGLAIVMNDRAALFVDGRYTLQAANEVDTDVIEVVHLADQSPEEWIADNLEPESILGYDPMLHTKSGTARLAKACKKAGADLRPTEQNLIDRIWIDQPAAPLAPVVAHEEQFSGRISADKRADIVEAMVANGADAVVLTMPDSIAWLLNLRGGDVAYSPLPLSFAILHDTGEADLYMDRRKMAPGLDQHLGNAVRVRDPKAFGGDLHSLAATDKRVQVDPATAAAWIFQQLDPERVVEARDPCALPKATKNDIEIAGTRAAHKRDGTALTRFLYWLANTTADGTVDEIAAADRLEALRRPNDHFRGLSFPTISGAGPNGAIVHYRVDEASNRRLETGTLFLVDSGAQYLDGTTDVTRTIAIGAPTDEMRDRFTRVLKGHIALATARFPVGTTGTQLDVLARTALWQAGLDYDHGTGHGVGSYLGVHEGPQRISKAAGNDVALKPGMIVSNEPGYYKAGAYGIRIENLVLVAEAGIPDGGERPLLAFETLTKAPIDRALIDARLLTSDELDWLNAYHADVRDSLTPLLDKAEAEWLRAATAPI